MYCIYRRPTDRHLIWKISNGHISSISCFVPEWGFLNRRIEWRYFRFDQIQDGGWWYLRHGHLVYITFVSRYRVFGVDVSYRSTSGWTKSKRGRRPSWKILMNMSLEWVIRSTFMKQRALWLFCGTVGENNARGVIRLVTIWNISCLYIFLITCDRLS